MRGVVHVPIEGFDPRAHGLLGACAAVYLFTLMHRWSGSGVGEARQDHLPRAYPKFAAGLVVCCATLVGGLAVLPTHRLPVVVGVACITAGLGRAYAAGLDARATRRIAPTLASTSRLPYWALTVLGVVAGLGLLWIDSVLGWFLVSVPALTALGYGAGGALFAPDRRPNYEAAARGEEWGSVLVWGGLSGVVLAVLAVASVDGPAVVDAAVALAGAVLAVSALWSWRAGSASA